MIQEQKDAAAFKEALAEMPAYQRPIVIEDVIDQVCWHGPVTREWLAETMGVELDD